MPVRELAEKQLQRMQRGIASTEREGGKDQPGAALDGTITLQENTLLVWFQKKTKGNFT